MGAIAGAVGFIGDEIERAVRKMVAAQVHRGGDGTGCLSLGVTGSMRQGAVLGAACSGIMGPGMASRQPMVDKRSGISLVYNGATYNYRELRSKLEGRGQTFESESDTEVVLKAFASFGDEFLEKLEGMFALAAWDPRRKSVLLARDRFGFKPLYWGEYRAGSGQAAVLFASEVRALLCTGLFPRRIDPIGLETYAWNGFVVGPGSLVQGIHCLAPGTAIEILAESGQTESRRYWSLGDYQGERYGSAEIGDALRTAVERQLRCDVPVGLFLSGGIDSSAVAALACDVSDQRLRTFNIAFEEAEFDESPYARAVAKELGTEHTEILITQGDFEAGLEVMLNSLDQPTFDGLNTFLVSSAVRRAGVRVALGGTGGDDLFGGNRTFLEIPRIAKWGNRLSPVPEALLRPMAAILTRLMTGKQGTIPMQTRWGKLADVLAARGRLLDLYQLTYGLFTPDFLSQLFARPASGSVRAGIPVERFREIEVAVQGNPEPYGISLMELAIFLGDRLLRDIDTTSGAVGLEVRVPFLDEGLIEVWRATGLQTSYYPMGKKQVIIDTALSRFDPSLFERPKAGFALPIDRWCKDQLGDSLDEAFSDAEHCRAVGINPTTADRLWTAFKRGDSGLYWSRIWSVFVYLRWCRREGLELDS